MGKNKTVVVLLVLLLGSGLLTVAFSFFYIKAVRDLRATQGDVLRLNQQQNLVRALIGDCMEYSKRNPSMDPILQSIGLKATNSPMASPRMTR